MVLGPLFHVKQRPQDQHTAPGPYNAATTSQVATVTSTVPPRSLAPSGRLGPMGGGPPTGKDQT